jgi:predicted MFS family arabinose efflux permease
MQDHLQIKHLAPAGATATGKNATLQIVFTVFFTFICYLTIGIPIAVLPGFVHADLGFGAVWAGLAISTQYLATFATRPYAGRLSDTAGSKHTVLVGLAFCALSGLLMLLSSQLAASPGLALGALLLGRLALGTGESLAATGSITWAIGRVGDAHSTRVISMNGVASFGALALGAPLGVVIDGAGGFAAIGGAVTLLGVIGMALAFGRAPVPVVAGARLGFADVFMRVLPHGMCQALGAIGFGVISAFITLFYASRHRSGAAAALTAFGTAFVLMRLVCGGAIRRFGGYPVSIVSFAFECAGLLLLWQAWDARIALCGAALSGAGFALVFPSLATEAVKDVPAANRGAALGAYTVFLDLALWIAGPLAGMVATSFGYAAVFLFAALAAASAVALSGGLYLRQQKLAAGRR